MPGPGAATVAAGGGETQHLLEIVDQLEERMLPRACGRGQQQRQQQRQQEEGEGEERMRKKEVRMLLSMLRTGIARVQGALEQKQEQQKSFGAGIVEVVEAEEGVTVRALERAPENVWAYEMRKTDEEEKQDAATGAGAATALASMASAMSTATLKWRNVFDVPVDYTVEMVLAAGDGGIFDLQNPQLAELRNRSFVPGNVSSAPVSGTRSSRMFLVVDQAIMNLHEQRIRSYFAHHGVTPYIVALPGEECSKRYGAVDTILEHCCLFGLHRREPIVGIGGGVILDIVGMAANLYRRGVPFVRVPTTLLAIVDASVGVKNGVDYESHQLGPQKNRIGSFYAPSAALLDQSFIATQDDRNIINGLGEIMKLALVRSRHLFEILRKHGRQLVQGRFQESGLCPPGIAQEVITLSIEIMLEELGPNLWEYKLERCVDFGHTFSKLLEMAPGVDLMHGEAVNIDGMLSVVLAHRRGLCTTDERDLVLHTMQGIGLPTISDACTPDLMWQACEDAVQHRNGRQRIPLIHGIGGFVCVSDITFAELRAAITELFDMHGLPVPEEDGHLQQRKLPKAQPDNPLGMPLVFPQKPPCPPGHLAQTPQQRSPDSIRGDTNSDASSPFDADEENDDDGDSEDGVGSSEDSRSSRSGHRSPCSTTLSSSSSVHASDDDGDDDDDVDDEEVERAARLSTSDRRSQHEQPRLAVEVVD